VALRRVNTNSVLSALELGALLSSYLEGALYKFLNECMNE